MIHARTGAQTPTLMAISLERSDLLPPPPRNEVESCSQRTRHTPREGACLESRLAVT
jgi:hypothetical protein